VIVIDANVLLDVWDPEPVWDRWSSGRMRTLSNLYSLTINAIIYGEILVSFATPAALDEKLDELTN
jgi:hypothetical protein